MKTKVKTSLETKLLLGIAIISVFSVAGTAAAGFVSLQKKNIADTNTQSITCETIELGDYMLSEKNSTQHISQLSSLTEKIKSELILRTQGRNGLTDNTLKGFLTARKENLLKTIRYNPKQALDYLLTQEEQNKLDESCRETQVKTSGKVIIRHSDTFDSSGSYEEYFLQTNSTEFTLYSPTAISQDISPNMTAQINGYQVDSTVLFDGSDLPSKEWEKVSAPPTNTTDKQQSIAVLLVNFSNKNNHLTKTTTEKMVFENVSNYYQENSYGNLTLSGDVYEVSISEKQGCNEQNIGELAKTEVAKTNNLSNYDKIIVIAPFGQGINQGCGWCGRSNLYGDTVYISSSCTSIAKDWGTVAHELGHAYGVRHATRYTCNTTQTGGIETSEEECYSEYGDNWSIMGESTSHMQFNAPHKEYLGWFDENHKIQTITEDGEYTIKSIETQETGTKAIKLQNSTDSYLYFEFRKPEYIESLGVLKGSVIHSTFADQKDKSIGFDFTSNTLASLQAGDSFTDPSTGSILTVKNMDTENSEVTIEITTGKIDFTPPEISISSSAFNTDLTQGQEISIDTQASDASGISKVELYYWYSEYDMRTNDPTLIATTSGEPFTFNLVADDFIQGSLQIFARAYDKAGEEYNTTNNSADSEIQTMFRPYFE